MGFSVPQSLLGGYDSSSSYSKDWMAVRASLSASSGVERTLRLGLSESIASSPGEQAEDLAEAETWCYQA